jgi:ribosomal protein S1
MHRHTRIILLLSLLAQAKAFSISQSCATRRQISIFSTTENDFDSSPAATSAINDKSEETRDVPATIQKPRLNSRAQMIQEAHARAIQNKEKREGPMAKKRRMMMFMKTKQREQARAGRVKRRASFSDRTPLNALPVMGADDIKGVVISLTPFGAYVDIGSECDGLLHVSQISRTTFVEHPKQVFAPGDKIMVRVRSVNPERKKLHLTMLPAELVAAEQADTTEDRIPLDEILVDDELWGQLKRVTSYGAYVEVGAAVDGFLHFMDHPSWENGSMPSDFMATGDRVRVWVSDVDLEQRRIKLTALRPSHLPGPRRELLG